MKLTVIIPTVGRESLLAALTSCAEADEVVAIVDEAVAGAWTPETVPRTVRLERVTGGDHGYTARMRGMEIATGTHLAFLDDDDVFTADAVQVMREAACDRPVIFRMDHPQHGVLWREPLLEFGNVGTPMFLVPSDPARLGAWVPHAAELPEPGGDFTFISGCCARMGEPVWREEIVARVRPRPTIAVVTPGSGPV